MSDISPTYQTTLQRIKLAVSNCGRSPGSVRLLAVSKKQSVDKIRQLHAQGQLAFGENYLQECLVKMTELSNLPIEWHFIGPIQSNKSRKIAEHFDWVQSVDSSKLLRRLSAQRPVDKPALNILLQVNIDEEAQKRGIPATETMLLAKQAMTLPGLKLRGLMAIPDPGKDQKGQVRSMQKMAGLFAGIQPLSEHIDTLSLGMSADIETAIAAGSTMVRVGTALFGPRSL